MVPVDLSPDQATYSDIIERIEILEEDLVLLKRQAHRLGKKIIALRDEAALLDLSRPASDDILDVDMIATGVNKAFRDKTKAIMEIIEDISKEQQSDVSLSAVLEKAEKQGIESERTKEIVRRLKHDGIIMEPKHDTLRITFSEQDLSISRPSRQDQEVIINIIQELSKESQSSAPLDTVLDRAERNGLEKGKALDIII